MTQPEKPSDLGAQKPALDSGDADAPPRKVDADASSDSKSGGSGAGSQSASVPQQSIEQGASQGIYPAPEPNCNMAAESSSASAGASPQPRREDPASEGSDNAGDDMRPADTAAGLPTPGQQPHILASNDAHQGQSEQSPTVMESPSGIPAATAPPTGGATSGEGRQGAMQPTTPTESRAGSVNSRIDLRGLQNFQKFPNGTVGKPYEHQVYTKEQAEKIGELVPAGMRIGFEGLEELGLELDLKRLAIIGTPSQAGQYELKLVCQRVPANSGTDFLIATASIFINPDPRSLWKEIEPEPGLPYPKGHTDCRRTLVGDTLVVGASRRGRSHAHNGTYRDDDFDFGPMPNGWILAAVADGAGSAKFSRKGSEIICRRCMSGVQAKASTNLAEDFEAALDRYRAEPSVQHERAIREALYNTLVPAAYDGVKEIDREAKERGAELKDYATTLVLTISKRYQFGWFVACFAIGDGGAALVLDPAKGHVKVLNRQDGGEFSGQTRFATMRDIWKDNESLFNDRIQFSIVDEFVALLAVTDGVSDPHFKTDQDFGNPAKWVDFWQLLRQSVRFLGDHESAHEDLLQWLDFWVDGEHDDRTIVVLVPGG